MLLCYVYKQHYWLCIDCISTMVPEDHILIIVCKSVRRDAQSNTLSIET